MEGKRQQQIITCKKCKGNNIIPTAAAVTFGVMFLLTAGLAIWIPILGWVVAPIAFILGIISFVVAMIPTGKQAIKCMDCHTPMWVDKKLYKQWKAL